MKEFDWKHTFPDVPESFHHKVSATLMHLPEEKEKIEMRKVKKEFTWKKAVVIAAAATLVLGTTAYAAGKVSSLYSTSSAIPDYTEMPSAEQVDRDLGFVPKLVETFENGFAFQDARIVKTSMGDEDGNEVGAFKELEIAYGKDGQRVNLFLYDESVEAELEETQSGELTSYEGVEFDYSSYVNKTVPSDYELTEEDQKLQEAGDLIFSYGSDAVEIMTVQSLCWNEDGVRYMLQTFDDAVTQEELISMAEELVDME